MSISIWEIIWSSGIIVKLVLLTLVVSSLFSWSIIFLKYFFIKKIKINNDKFYKIFKEAGKFSEVARQTEGSSFTPYRILFMSGQSELSKIKNVFTEDVAKEKVKEHFSVFGMEIVKRALQKGVLKVNLELEDKLSLLASVGSVTPFIGLFGTVWGIINSFAALSGGGANLDAVAPGIAEALIATAAGLAAAIPANWFYNFFVSKNGQINNELEVFEQEFLNTVERSFLK